MATQSDCKNYCNVCENPLLVNAEASRIHLICGFSSLNCPKNCKSNGEISLRKCFSDYSFQMCMLRGLQDS